MANLPSYPKLTKTLAVRKAYRAGIISEVQARRRVGAIVLRHPHPTLPADESCNILTNFVLDLERK